MSKTQTPSPRSGPDGQRQPEELNRDTVLDVLNNTRRRYVVHILKRRDGESVSDGELAERIAAWELGKPANELSYKERKRVKNALRQFHLPKMEEMGFVEYDSREGAATLSPAAAEEDFYVDVLPKRHVPWGMYYLGLSALSLACLAGLIVGASLLGSVPALGVFAGFTAALTVSSAGHFYDNYYRMRLGARETPPEVDGS